MRKCITKQLLYSSQWFNIFSSDKVCIYSDHIYCNYWQRLGFCNPLKAFFRTMAVRCKKTCALCGGDFIKLRIYDCAVLEVFITCWILCFMLFVDHQDCRHFKHRFEFYKNLVTWEGGWCKGGGREGGEGCRTVAGDTRNTRRRLHMPRGYSNFIAHICYTLYFFNFYPIEGRAFLYIFFGAICG